MDEVDIVVAHRDRVTLRVGDIFLKVDPDEAQVDIEVEAMMLAPVPTPAILWREPPVLALAAVPGEPLGRLGGRSSASPAAWCAAGRLIRTLHDAPLPPWRGRSNGQIAAELDAECAWLIESGLVSSGVVARNRVLADTALRAVAPVFTHGDLQLDHIFIEGDEVTGVLDWSEAGPGDPLCDLATVTFGHADRLDAVVEGYGGTVDVEIVRAWWSVRALRGVRWLIEHGWRSSGLCG